MAHYKATLTPAKTPGGRWRTHMRAVDVAFTAKNDDEAERRVRQSVVSMFVGSGDDFAYKLTRL